MAIFKVVPVDNDPKETEKKWAYAIVGTIGVFALFYFFVSDFGLYLHAVRDHYWTLMTGAASLMITAWEKVRPYELADNRRYRGGETRWIG